MIVSYLKKYLKRLAALGDATVILLIALGLLPLWYIDPVATKTILEWAWTALVFLGICVCLSRIVFPHVKMSALMDHVYDGNLAAAVFCVGIMIFLASLFIGMVVWAKV